MDRKSLNLLAKELKRQKAVLLKEVADVDQDLRFISEANSPELEEAAQEQRTFWLLSRLDSRGRAALIEIEDALTRIGEGTYGDCEDCGMSIPVARMRIVPATRYCVSCASVYEKKRRLADAGDSPVNIESPRDVSVMTDQDREEMVREQIQEDGRVEMEDLRISCRAGVLYLEGVLPQESQRRILTQIVSRLHGLEEIVDQVQVENLLWEQERPQGEELRR